MALLVGLIGGAGEAFGTLRETRLAPLTRPGNLVLALLCLGCMTITAQTWARYFAGFTVWGVLNGLLGAVVGHSPTSPNVPVARWFALLIAIFYAVTTVTTLRFTTKRKLSIEDRVALAGWFVSFAWLVNVPPDTLYAMGAGSAVLVAAWWWDRHRHHQRQIQVPVSRESSV